MEKTSPKILRHQGKSKVYILAIGIMLHLKYCVSVVYAIAPSACRWPGSVCCSRAGYFTSSPARLLRFDVLSCDSNYTSV